MKTLTCDICQAVIQTPAPNRNYFHVAHRDVCESCHDKLEFQIKPIVRSKSPFDYAWYDQLLQANIEKAVSKGKVDFKIVI
jgi:hypothetical protein